MKKQIFIIILLLMGGVSTFGQSFKLDATGANDMRLRTSATDRLTILPTSGNVGIGTITPATKLQVFGDFSLNKRTDITTVGIQNALDRLGASILYINTSGTVTINGIAGGFDGMIVYLYTSNINTLILNNENAAASFSNQIVTNTGASITINGRGGVTLLYENSGWRVIGFTDETGYWNSKGNAGTVPATNFIGTTDNQSFVARTNNVERMRILNTGNIGIGTNNPDTKLHLANAGTGQTAAANTILTLENNGDVNLNFLSGNTTSSKGGILFGSATGNAKGQINYTPSLNRMDFATTDLTRMSITGTGNVGIGTITPDAKLEVAGSFAISGKASMTSNQNNFNLGGKSVIKVSGGGPFTLTGIAGGVDGMIVHIYVTQSTDLIIAEDSGSSSAGNKIETGSNVDITISQGGGATLMYDGDAAYWRVIGFKQ
jgi:hypothetical protein